MPKRSSSPSVWAKSRAVTVTSWPRSAMRAISGRKITAWGELVMSTQTLTGPAPYPTARLARASVATATTRSISSRVRFGCMGRASAVRAHSSAIGRSPSE